MHQHTFWFILHRWFGWVAWHKFAKVHLKMENLQKVWRQLGSVSWLDWILFYQKLFWQKVTSIIHVIKWWSNLSCHCWEHDNFVPHNGSCHQQGHFPVPLYWWYYPTWFSRKLLSPGLMTVYITPGKEPPARRHFSADIRRHLSDKTNHRHCLKSIVLGF